MLNTNIKEDTVDKQVLFKIRNLKQYFPVKGSRHEFVRANDGITLDIYAGETLGIVGESGCGKSTLGRVLLQLYKQTDGETIYYGHSRNRLAPQYVGETYKNLRSHIEKSKEMDKKAQEKEAELKKMQASVNFENKDDAVRFYREQAEYEHMAREAKGAFLNIVELVGGFYTVADTDTTQKIFLEHYAQCEKLMELEQELVRLTLDYEDLKIKDIENKSASDNPRLIEYESKIALKEAEIVRQNESVDQKQKAIDELKVKYVNDPEFQKYEQYLDYGVNLARLKYNEMRRLRAQIQFIFQDPYSSLNPRLTIGQIIGEGLITHNYYKRNSSVMQDYVMEVMENCGLQSYMIHRYPHQFSGGQRQRIGIARSLAVKPKFVVCDEAVSALDVSIQSQIINLLKDLKEKSNLTYMFISHDLSVVKYISTRIAVMYLGNIVELADSEDMFKKPLHPYTEALLLAIPTTEKRQNVNTQLLEGDIPSPINPPKGCKFHTRCKYCMDICKEVIPEFLEIEPDHFVACHYKK
ncbi:MAG: ATP-binding cassette domain-containing protein [Clostridiales bacterium]|jgi:peptide/nickel transport system ATP-binding protein|nr:ATP-binding cassette domain-containing protein [Clostridiales bacterium]